MSRVMRLVTLAIIAAGTLLSAQPAPDLAPNVRAFVEQYLREAPSLVAHEEYVQIVTTARGGKRQVTTAELVMVRLPGSAGWVSFRDVLTVDKRRIGDREQRLLKLLQSPAPDALAQARQIAQESARYNLGAVSRTTNVPDTALEFLHPTHAPRIKLEPLRNETIAGRPVAVFRFSETRGPSIIRSTEGLDLLARGRVWVDPASGAIVRTELLLADRSSNGATTVDFFDDPRLGMRVPVKMTELYRGRGETIDATATYSDFRRFTVATRENITKPPGY